MKKVLITGNSGYIGSHLSKLLDGEYEIYGLDLNDPQYVIPHFKSDIRNNIRMAAKFDAVIHLAALVNVGESQKNPTDYYMTNLIGTLNVLHLEYDNFIFASTGAAEGCASAYGTSKKAAEDCVREWCSYKNIPYTIFRFYNVIGSAGYEPTNMDGLMYNLIKAGKETGVFNVYGDDYDTYDGTALRDYVHVKEVCQAIKSAIELPSDGTIQNLATGSGYSVLQMVDFFKEVNNMDFEVNILPRRPGDLARSVLSDVSPYMKEMFRIDEKLKVI